MTATEEIVASPDATRKRAAPKRVAKRRAPATRKKVAKTRMDGKTALLPPRRKPDSLKRALPLKRKYRFEPLSEGHLKYCWAAYRRGGFANLIDADLDATEFTSRFLSVAGQFSMQGGELVAVLGPTPKGDIPIAIVAINYDGGERRYPIAFPHVEWFPEASDRNKVEAGVRFFLELKRRKTAIVLARHERDKETRETRYFNHLCKYGLLRPVGHLRDHFAEGVNAMIYETVGH